MNFAYNIYNKNKKKKKSRSKEKSSNQKIRGKSSLKKIYENIKYKTISKFQKINSYKIKEIENYLINENEIYLLGKKFDLKKNDLFEIKLFFEKLKIFTYTKKFCYKNKIVDDIGWSCCLKTGQMLLINFIIKNLLIKNKNFSEEKIINFFINKNIFGICNFLEFGFKNFGKDFEKQWNQIEFFQTASKILKKKKKIFLKNLLLNFKKKNSKRKKKKKKIEKTLKKGKGVLLIINFQLGQKKINLEKKNFLEKLIKNKFFCGAVAGEKNLSYYIFGFFKNKFIYLDPHEILDNNKLNDFKVKNFNEISFCDLHPNISVSFFFKDFKFFEEFKFFFEDLGNDLICFVDDEKSEDLDYIEIDLKNKDKKKINGFLGKNYNFDIDLKKKDIEKKNKKLFLTDLKKNENLNFQNNFNFEKEEKNQKIDVVNIKENIKQELKDKINEVKLKK